MGKEPRAEMPSREQLRIWRNYLETTESLRAHLARKMQADSGISLGDYAVLLALTEAPGGRYRPSELATQIEWERSRLSHHLRRMEKRRLIERFECAEDNRGAEVAITRAGRDAFKESSYPHLQEIHRVFVKALSQTQLVQLGEIIQEIRGSLGLDAGARD